MMEEGDTRFGTIARRRMVDDFVVSYYNGSLKPNVAEKNPSTERDVEYLMDGPQFDKIRKTEIWSYSDAIGTGYQYRVTYRDRRFSDLERLLWVYSGTVEVDADEKGRTEQSLYQLILLLIKEGRLPKTFKIQTAEEAQEKKVVAVLEEMSRSVEELDRRVRALEEQVASQQALRSQTGAMAVPEGTPSV